MYKHTLLTAMDKEQEELEIEDLKNYCKRPGEPSTGERERRASGVLDNQDPNSAATSWEQTIVTAEQSNLLSELQDHRVRRFDFDLKTTLLVVRQPCPAHDIFSAQLAGEVNDWLKGMASCGGSSGGFASKIISGGSSRIILKETDLEKPSGPVRRQPDAQFQHQDAAYPGLVIEISYSHDGKDLHALARDYILHSNGDIKTVVGIDINQRRESTVSVWRPEYSCQEGDSVEYLDVRQDIANKPFRSANGSAMNPEEHLEIMLSDFATDEISSGLEPVWFSMSFERLSDLVSKAEQMQQVREPKRGQGGVKSTRRTRTRKPPSSPADEWMPENADSQLSLGTLHMLARELEYWRLAKEAEGHGSSS